jgi:hypothetical protein
MYEFGHRDTYIIASLGDVFQRKEVQVMTSKSERPEGGTGQIYRALVFVMLAISLAIPVFAADVPAVSEPSTFGAIDGEFSLKGLKGLYRWNVIQTWTKGENAIRADDTIGVVNGEFEVRAMYFANSNGREIGFHNQATIDGTTDEKGAIFYPPGQRASFSHEMAGNHIKYVLMNNAYHVVGTGPMFEIAVVTKDGYLTCADGTEVSVFAIYAEEISDDPFSSDSGFKDIKLYEPGKVSSAYLVGSYRDGRIVLDPDQQATIQSNRKLKLADGTILLPNEDGIYHIEVQGGLPTFVEVTVEDGG